jgi:hypothetical protein
MEAAAHDHDHHHGPLPASGRALDRVAISATLHCLTGCAIGEVLGMVVGTALGLPAWGTIVLAIALAFAFGYGLTSLPLLRSGMALSAVVPIALASDTFSIATMEVVDNAIMLGIPGALHAGVGDLLFWGSLSVALVIAGFAAFPVNRWLLKRGRGHAVVHETGIHGGPSPRTVAVAAVAAAIFGTTVLAVEAFGGGDGHGGGHGMAPAASSGGHGASDAHGGHAAGEATAVRGLAVSQGGQTLALERTELRPGQAAELRFRVVDASGDAVRDFEVQHEKRMHLIVVRRDGAGFQHLHPRIDGDGVWSTPITLPDPGSYRVFADFRSGGQGRTLGADLAVDGEVDWRPLPAPATTADAGDGYAVDLAAGGDELHFTVTRAGKPVEVEPYLGAGGHLVALREGDLAYLHVHPVGGAGGAGDAIAFQTQFPSAGRYRLYLQFKHDGRVRTAAFTRAV